MKLFLCALPPTCAVAVGGGVSILALVVRRPRERIPLWTASAQTAGPCFVQIFGGVEWVGEGCRPQQPNLPNATKREIEGTDGESSCTRSSEPHPAEVLTS